MTSLLLLGLRAGVPYTATITDLLCVPIWVLIVPDSSTKAVLKLTAETLVAKQENIGKKLPENFAYDVSLSYS
jgi:hypothetical protein